tara:strand:- start:353 stop:2014 length:1662 start_codon:yes stop_codon:yes gene_type:complete
MQNNHPALNERAKGWLNFLHQKATTSDDWSEAGTPNEWWDQTSTPPMCSFPRFDLQESTYAIGLMADKTPAWREVYSEILDEIAERSITYWAAVDWLSQFGHDPNRQNYPEAWKGTLIPEEFWGNYDAPGWTANGVAPWGFHMDPIGADGNLFFKGWLNLTQSLHTYVSGYDKWSSSFSVAGAYNSRFEWTQHQLADHLHQQWSKTPMGPHCENTKAWPFCLSAAGLGLMMYDKIFDNNFHSSYSNWLSFTKDKYYGFDKSGALQWVTMYFDEINNHHHKTLPTHGLAVAFYAKPQDPHFAELLYRGAINFLGWDNPSIPITNEYISDPRMFALGLTMSREFDDQVTYERLKKYAEENFEPQFFGINDSKFGFWFNFGENWPRGQLSALAMCAEVCEPDAWENLFNNPNLTKFYSPSIQGIDFPSLYVEKAFHDDQKGKLYFSICDGDKTKTNRSTTVEVFNLPNSNSIDVLCDGKVFKDYKIIDNSKITINTEVANHNFEITTGYYLSKLEEQDLNKKLKEYNNPNNENLSSSSKVNSKLILPTNLNSCGCC